MSLPPQALTRAGRLLFRELPEEYRYRDNPTADELGDLEAYLHGTGHLLDLVRATTEQSYADAFAEETDLGGAIQPWLLPYLAELVGATLLAPDEDRRRAELNNSVLWSKAKGTLHNADDIGDVISGAETSVQEGWRLTLTCPRPGLPPFSVPVLDDAQDVQGRTPVPLGCPDFRKNDRAIVDPVGGNPLFRLRIPKRDADGLKTQPDEVYWQPRARGGVPCFAGSYADGSARCPDLRDPEITDQVGAHPGRSLIHIRPPDGLFEAGLREVLLVDARVLGLSQDTKSPEIDPAFVLKAVEGIENAPHDKVVVRLNDDLSIPPGAEVLFRNILFVGEVDTGTGPRPARIRIRGRARVTFQSCAAQHVSLVGNGASDPADIPALNAHSTLLGQVTGPNRFATLVYCTVMGELDVARLYASDCLFETLSSNLNCAEDQSCIRYSRFTPLGDTSGCFSKDAPTNTNRDARFIRRYLPDATEKCVLRLPNWGEPGLGVLDTLTPKSITAGAEDDGELGAFHNAFYAAQIRALSKKLSTYLPLGQEIALAYDPILALSPPRVADLSIE